MPRSAVFLAVLLLTLLPAPSPAEQSLLSAAEWNALRNEFSGDRAWHWTNRIAEYDRNIGSEGYIDAMRYIEGELKRIGVTRTRVVELPYDQPSWTGVAGELWLTEPVERKVGSWHDAGTALAINSRSADVAGELVDVGRGDSDADYTGKAVAGKIALACGPVDRAYRLAVFRHGALGLITCAQKWPGPHFEFPDHIGWHTIPATGENGREPTWAFSVSLRTAEELRDLLRAGPVKMRVKVETRIKTPGRMQLLIGTIPGERVPNEAVVYTAHLDHMRGGANDDASGCGNLLETARTMLTLMRQGKIRRPLRDVEFWFAPETVGEYAYFAANPEERKKILININQEMVAENQTTLGSAALFERAPWSLPTYLNDVMRHFVRHVFDTNVGTINANERFSDPIFSALGSRDHFFSFLVPFYTSSDQEAFAYGPIGIPAVHATCFPDYNLHTNRDTIYNVDATQLRRIGLIFASTGYFVAAADESVTARLTNEVAAGSQEILAHMSGVSGRLLEGGDERAFLTARQAIRTTTGYVAACMRAVSHFGRSPLVESSAVRLEAHGRLLEGQMEDAFRARTGRQALPADTLTAEERSASQRVPAFRGTLADILARRKQASPPVPRVANPLLFEIESLIDGRRTALEIYRVVKAESLFGGTPYYGPISLTQVLSRLDALAEAGVIAQP